MNYSKCHFDFATLPWLTSPRKQLDLQGVALGLIKLPPNQGYTFTHRHRLQEEVYLVIEGNGVLLVDGELLDLVRGDAVRVAPAGQRALKAGDLGLLVVCAGGVAQGYPRNPNSRYLIDDGIADYDDIPPWYQGDEVVRQRNQVLKKRRKNLPTAGDGDQPSQSASNPAQRTEP